MKAKRYPVFVFFFISVALDLILCGNQAQAESDRSRMLPTRAVILDARCGSGLLRSSIAGAQKIQWDDFTDHSLASRRGYLNDNFGTMAETLRVLGVHPSRSVVIIGGGKRCWGEEGRIAWMLEYLGVTQVRFLSQDEWDALHIRPVSITSPAEKWSVSINESLRFHLVSETPSPNSIILDVRSQPEYLGTASFAETRTSHVPSAIHLDWRTFFKANGSYDLVALRKHMLSLGASSETRIISYCSGGVRSAYMTMRLRDAGFPFAANDDGGMWAYDALHNYFIAG